MERSGGLGGGCGLWSEVAGGTSWLYVGCVCLRDVCQ
jgi:hypothetical protein